MQDTPDLLLYQRIALELYTEGRTAMATIMAVSANANIIASTIRMKVGVRRE
jgi:hypothetical protein